MKVLILSDNFLNGGMETHIAGYIENLKNIDFYLAVTNFRENDKNKSLFKKIKKINFYDSIAQNTILELQKFIFNEGIDIIHAHTENTYVVASVLAYRMNLSYFITIHGPSTISALMNSWNLKCMDMVFKNAKKVYAVSQEISSILKNIFIVSEVIPNSIDLNVFTYKEVCKDSKKWAIVSRLDFDKTYGIKTAIKMMNNSRLKALDIYGTGNGEYDLKEFINLQELSYSVNFKGDCEDVNGVLEIENYEGVFAMGRAALEALAKGYPVILIGYDSIKGPIDRKSIEFMKITNFSGRNITNIREDYLSPALDECVGNHDVYNLREVINENFNIKKAAKNYSDDLFNTPQQIQLKELNDFILKSPFFSIASLSNVFN